MGAGNKSRVADGRQIVNLMDFGFSTTQTTYVLCPAVFSFNVYRYI
jgi:hypothetical protein